MVMDGCLTDIESLYYILLTKDAILTENMDVYLKGAIAYYDENLLHTILCMYINNLEANDLNKEKDIIINIVQFTIANKRVDSFMKEWQNYVNSIRSKYGKRYDIARDRFGCYLKALYLGKDQDLEYQSFINDIVDILGIASKKGLCGCHTRVRNIFNKFRKKGKK